MTTTTTTTPALAVAGLHHITGFAKDPRENVAFYRDVLGLRLVKVSVNQDDPTTYHLYYGDYAGNPGTAITFFPWQNVARRRPGNREAGSVAYSVPIGSLAFWRTHLEGHGVSTFAEETRFGETVLRFEAPIGGEIELVETTTTLPTTPWPESPVPVEHQIQGFHSTTIFHRDPAVTAQVLTDVLGYREIAQEDSRTRYAVGEGQPNEVIDLVADPTALDHRPGAGTIHHIAFRARTVEEHVALREQVAAAGFHITPVIDLFYFNAVYFREPGGVLFEIASDPPGFTADEPLESLGSALMLPPFLESERARIEAALPSLT